MPRSRSPKAAVSEAALEQQFLDVYRARSAPDRQLIYAMLLIMNRHGMRGLRDRIDRLHAWLHQQPRRRVSRAGTPA